MKDSIGKIFTLLEKMGCDINWVLANHNLKLNQTKKYSLSHEKFDAAAGLMHHFKNHAYTQLPSIPQANCAIGLTAFERITLLWNCIYLFFIKKFPIISWKKYDASKNYTKNIEGISYYILDEVMTEKIETYIKRENITINSLLLFHLNQITSNALQEPGTTNCWGITVNMRGLIQPASEYSNCFSCVPIEISSTTSINELKQQISKQLHHKTYWSTLWLSMALGFLKENITLLILQHMVKRKKFFITGIYSNLGTWSMPESADEEVYFGSPAITIFQPIAGCVIKYNNKFILTLQIQPTLCENRAEIDTHCADWAASVLQVINNN